MALYNRSVSRILYDRTGRTVLFEAEAESVEDLVRLAIYSDADISKAVVTGQRIAKVGKSQ